MTSRVPVWLGVAASIVAGVAVADQHADLGFTQGRAPIVLDRADPQRWVGARRCGNCHPDEHADWHASRHRVAHTNPIYQAGLVDEPRRFCVNCHSPLAPQAAEVADNLPWYRSQHTALPWWGPTPTRHAEPRAAEGVTCAACHWRDGAVLVAEAPRRPTPHPVRVTPELRQSSFCAGCHEFRMPRWIDGRMELTDEPMQSTFSEWRAWADAGGQATCQTCHMPRGRHTFAGAHDRDALRDAVRVRVRREGDVRVFVIESVAVGHHLPSGDLFRAFTLEVDGGDGWRVIDHVGRRYEVGEDADGHARKHMVDDTALRPGVAREVRWSGGPARWRLVFHYGSEADEARGVVVDEPLTVVLRSGTAR